MNIELELYRYINIRGHTICMSKTPLYTSRIKAVRFSVNGTQDIINDSSGAVSSYELFRGGVPQPGGLYDAHFGTTDHGYRCQTCFNNKKSCMGHAGHILLRYPLISPMCYTDLRKWLKLICFKCGLPIINDIEYKKFNRLNRLDEAAKIARSGSSARKCVHCGAQHPNIKKDIRDQSIMIAEEIRDGKVVSKYQLYPHIIKEIVERIPDYVVELLGKQLESHPRKFVVEAIQVPATTIRPDVKKIGGGRSTNDDLTSMLQALVKNHDKLPTVIGISIDEKLGKQIFELNALYQDFIKNGGNRVVSTGSGANKSIARRLRGKDGRFRRNLMGKRVWKSGRSTITGDPSLRIDELGMPINFARSLQVEETVQEYNKDQLMVYFLNGSKRYPGCSKIIKRLTGAEYGIDNLRGDFELEIGDKIHRDIITGDVVTFNRQPSLKPSNIGCHKVVVSDNPHILTLRMNVIACKLYDADFDGDQLGLSICKNIC